LSKIHGVAYKFIECHIEDLSEINNRRINREILPSQIYIIPINEVEYEKSIKSLKRPIDHEYLIVDTTLKLDEYISKVMEYLMK